MESRSLSKLHEGEVIPLFTLKDHKNNSVAADIFRGKSHVLMFLLPSVEEEQSKKYLFFLQNMYGDLKKIETEIITISQDPVEKLSYFVEHNNISFLVLSDPQEKALKKFTKEDTLGRKVYGLFIVDRYNALVTQYFSQPHGELPDRKTIETEIEYLESLCPECSASGIPENLDVQMQ